MYVCVCVDNFTHFDESDIVRVMCKVSVIGGEYGSCRE